jgi:hypothetical protein
LGLSEFALATILHAVVNYNFSIFTGMNLMNTAASVTTSLNALLDEMVANVHASNFIETLRLVHLPLRDLYLDALANGLEVYCGREAASAV